MIITAGLVVGTMAMVSTATPLQPTNITRVSNNEIKVYASKDMTVHLSHASGFEIVIDKGHDAIDQGDGKSKYDVKVKKGTTLNINAQTGWNADSFKIGNNKIVVLGN